MNRWTPRLPNRLTNRAPDSIFVAGIGPWMHDRLSPLRVIMDVIGLLVLEIILQIGKALAYGASLSIRLLVLGGGVVVILLGMYFRSFVRRLTGNER